MPERPDLEYVIPRLDAGLRGARIASVEVRKPVVLRLLVRGDPSSLLVGQTFSQVTRRAHFVLFSLAGAGLPGDAPLEMVIAPMLAGRFRLSPGAEKPPGDRAVSLTLEDGRVLHYRDDVQMGKVYVIPQGQRSSVPGLASVGVDVLNTKTFTWELFQALCLTRKDQVKVFLMDKTALDSFGNAYADEVLFAAKIHPKTMVRRLTAIQMKNLYQAIPSVLNEANRVIETRNPPLDEKVRDFLKARGRDGQPCLRCGTTLRAAGVHGHDACFCPTCQPDVSGRSLVDWRKIPEGG